MKKTTLISIILMAALFPTSLAQAQGTLIGPSTQNGSFEDGVASPWLGLDVEQDAAFASQGEWFAVLQGTNTPTARALGFQGVPASPSSGLTFIVSFDARNATAGFDSVNVDVVARNIDGTFVTPSITPVLAPPLASAAWGTFQTRIQLPESWDGGSGSINIAFLFKKNLAVGGTTYVGYLDNVILQQIPEPSVFALCGLVTILWTAGLLRRRRKRVRKMKRTFATVILALAGEVLLAPAVTAQGTLIGPSTQNGSFEDGVLAPWGVYFTVAEDSSFATQGSWFAQVQSSLLFAADLLQNLSPDPNSGLHFLLTFDARIGDPGYVVVNTRMSGRSPGGASLNAVVTPVAAPPLSASSWQSYQYELQMPQAWDTDGFSFAIRFSRTSTDGVLRTAYLDNVVLTQVPEPSVFALGVLGALLCAGGWLRQRLEISVSSPEH